LDNLFLNVKISSKDLFGKSVSIRGVVFPTYRMALNAVENLLLLMYSAV